MNKFSKIAIVALFVFGLMLSGCCGGGKCGAKKGCCGTCSGAKSCPSATK